MGCDAMRTPEGRRSPLAERARLAVLAVSTVVAGCRPDAATGSSPPDATAPPVEEHLTLSHGAYEVNREPTGWLRARKGEWIVFSSPDQTAVIGFLGATTNARPLFDGWGHVAPELLGISGVVEERPSLQSLEMGPDHLLGSVRRGPCRLGSRSATLSVYVVLTPPSPPRAVATSWPGSDQRAFVALVLAEEALPEVRAAAAAAVDSIRRKR
jgi:hypothetical protein